MQSINLNVCKKLDNRVTKVIATASHVVMYSLQNQTTWVRRARARCLSSLAAEPLTAGACARVQRLMDVEGSLFIVKRCGSLLQRAPPQIWMFMPLFPVRFHIAQLIGVPCGRCCAQVEAAVLPDDRHEPPQYRERL